MYGFFIVIKYIIGIRHKRDIFYEGTCILDSKRQSLIKISLISHSLCRIKNIPNRLILFLFDLNSLSKNRLVFFSK